MTREEMEVFGVTEVQEKNIESWISSRLACIVGADGRGGSGVFVQLEDGHLAVLTACHVVISCILTGEITVCRMSSCQRSYEPTSIRIDGPNDVALLIVDRDLFDGAFSLLFSEWTCSSVNLSKGMPAIISGIVGEWKHINIKERIIPQFTKLHYWTSISNPDAQCGMISYNVDKSNSEIPNSFGGMSGGPAFSIDQKLLGINTEEVPLLGEILVTPISKLYSLHTPFQPSEKAPQDYMRQEAILAFEAKEQRTDKTKNKKQHTGVTIPMQVYVEYFWSRSSPDSNDGHIGRIFALRFRNSDSASRYIMNTEAIFRWYDGDTDEDRLMALKEELEYSFLEGLETNEVSFSLF